MGKCGLKHAHKVSHHAHKTHHGLLHVWELILVWTIWFMSLMFAWSSNLPNNNSFSYPLQKVSTVECRTLYRNDMPDSCKINLPIIHWANYSAYEDNGLYRSIYTALRAAPYSDSWNQKIGAHAWLDIATARGTPLYSIWDGEVFIAGWNSAYGNVVKIKYVYQWEIVYAVYAHMDSMSVKVWDKVSRGQNIWTVWNSGNTSGKLWWYHVHFEIDKDNYWRPAYSYTNCPDLSKWHYKIIQNGLCRIELFTYQYDPIKIFEANSTYVPPVEDDEDDTDEIIEIVEDTWTNITEILSGTNTTNTNNDDDDELDKWTNIINNNNTDNNTDDNENNDTDNNTNDDHNSADSDDTDEDVITDTDNDIVIIIDPIEENENKEDPRLLDLDFDGVKLLAEHFVTLWDIEMRSELKERNLMFWETITLDIEVFKKWEQANRTGNWFNWVLQTPFLMLTSNNNIDIDVNYLQLITKWKAQVEITWTKPWKSSLIIEFGWKKVWMLDITIN